MNSQEDFLPTENLDAVPWTSQQKEKKRLNVIVAC
jgi:hypothetical protein